MTNYQSFLWGMLMMAVCCIGLIAGIRMERGAANAKCQEIGYSAGHYEKEGGLICEQWIEAAKVRPR